MTGRTPAGAIRATEGRERRLETTPARSVMVPTGRACVAGDGRP